jgi:hypothetical protein
MTTGKRYEQILNQDLGEENQQRVLLYSKDAGSFGIKSDGDFTPLELNYSKKDMIIEEEPFS